MAMTVAEVEATHRLEDALEDNRRHRRDASEAKALLATATDALGEGNLAVATEYVERAVSTLSRFKTKEN